MRFHPADEMAERADAAPAGGRKAGTLPADFGRPGRFCPDFGRGCNTEYGALSALTRTWDAEHRLDCEEHLWCGFAQPEASGTGPGPIIRAGFKYPMKGKLATLAEPRA